MHHEAATAEPATPVAETAPEAAVDSTKRPARAEPPAAPVAVAPPPAPPPPPDLWQRIRGGFRMANLQGPLVQEWEQWYSTRPDYVGRMIDRSSHFLYHVMDEVERRGMPTEVALLPMIESAYNPKAYSRSHASGMWQFIPSTGKDYGLRQNFWYDGRRDPIAATSAALEYLQKLYGMFGSWELALAAYNWGEGAVGRAIARNQAKGLPGDYESLTLPPETRNYVPKLQAVKNIVANPQAYGLRLADLPNRPYFATVTVERHIDVKLAARLAELPLEEFIFLNPAHNKPVIKAQGSETILLPLNKVEAFRRNLAAHDKPLVSWQAYTVKRSDKPESVAASHGMSLATLKEVNGIVAPKKIVAGQTIMVPVKGDAEPHLPDLPAPKLTPVRAAGKAKPGQRTVAVKGKAPAQASAKKVAARTSGAPAKRVKLTLPSTKKPQSAGK
jgi:membrane-bound lytic murein transglycosylase D